MKVPVVRSILKSVGRPKLKNLIGFVDQIGPNFIRGWAADCDEPGTALELRVYLDHGLVAHGFANLMREDLKIAGYGQGFHGYQLPVPTKALFCAETLTLATVASNGGERVVLRQQMRNIEARTTPVLHLDASDLIEFLTHHRELSGIQRVQAGYLLSLGNARIGTATCRICTRFKHLNCFLNVPHQQFNQLLEEAGDLDAVSKSEWHGHVQRFKLGLTSRAAFQAGDTLFTLGAPWALDQHNEIIRCVKYFYGARYLQIFYDLIPISAPEVVPAPLIPRFASAMAAMSIHADHVFSISSYSKDDLLGTLHTLGRTPPEISVVPMGGTITDAEKAGTRRAGAPTRLGVKGPFVLCVGTLEPRKNHMLLFHVWRRLVAKYGAANVPRLVLVGRVGWYMEDFMRTLKVTNYAEETIVHLQGVSNADLSELYDSCLFTVFPSFTEGWGLPITESMARGKVCLCSNTTSMPEAGGEHAMYIDPYDASAAFEMCDRLIGDRAALAEHEAHLRATFKPPSWTEASEALRDQLAGLTLRLVGHPPSIQRKPIAFGRPYQFYNIEAAEPDASSTQVFANFLDQEDALDLLEGWNWFDLDVNCTWACGPKAELRLVPPADTPNDLVAYIHVVVPPIYKDAIGTISVDGTNVGRFSGMNNRRLMVPIANARAAQPVSIIFTYDESRKPDGADQRYLGIGVRSIVVYPRDDLAGRLRLWEDTGVERV